MPNWAENRLTISGDKKSLAELREQMARPYEVTYLDRVNKAIKQETQEGVFMLWNAIRPTDLRAYWELDKLEAELAELNNPTKPEQTPEEFMEAVKERLVDFNEKFADGVQDAFERMQHDIATKQDWYNWNLRNWGTKWDITEQAWVTSESDNELCYEFMTAWSCPNEAVNNLAKQYPTLTFTLQAWDTSMDWRVEIGWDKGEQKYEIDLPLDHSFLMETQEECWACGAGSEDPDFEPAGDSEDMERLGCAINPAEEVEKFLKEVQ